MKGIIGPFFFFKESALRIHFLLWEFSTVNHFFCMQKFENYEACDVTDI